MTEFDVSGFLAVFFDETRQRLQSINEKLLLFEAGELDEQGLLQLRRDVHTIKGSAQMLGVQDIGKLAHLFEDAIECAVPRTIDQRQPVVQFLYDLHDSLQHRLQEVDGKPRLDTDAMVAAFDQLKQEMDKSPDGDQSKVDKHAAQRIRKKRPGVPKNLIAAVMGSIEDSLQDGGDKNSERMDTVRDEPRQAGQSEAPIDYRPDLASLDMDATDAGQGSGDFLRVDRTRLSRLSNQIIELGSGRYSETLPEQQLEQVVQGFCSLKEAMMTDADRSAQGRWQGEFERQLRQLHDLNELMRSQQRRATAMMDDLRDQVLGLMLRPLNTVFAVFPRTVRDIGMRCGKKVQLLLAGDAVEMDQVAAEALTEPLIHLINNAVAHGIEEPDERRKRGKPEHGQITITASQKGGDIEIVVIDDGQGLDIDRIRDRAVARGYVSQAEISEMDDSEIMELIFQPGFSTREQVDELAGRGMGMRVVQDVLHELTGTIHIHSQRGQGTRFSLTIPASLAVRQTMVFRIAGQRFGMLVNLIRQVVAYANLEIKSGHGPYRLGYINFEHHRVPLIDLRYALNQVNEQQPEVSNERSVVIVEHLEGFLGLVVDEVLVEKEILVREIDPYLKRYQPVGLMGCTIISDGSVLLLIDPDGLKEMWRTAPDPELVIGANGRFSHRMLLADDSSIALKIEKNMFEAMGFSVDTAIGGKDTLEKIALHNYDLLVTDLGMPEMDGIELTKQIRTMDKFKALPILMLATVEAVDEQQRAIAAGANAYLLKRCLKSEEGNLVSTLSRLLGTDENPDKNSVIDEAGG